MTRKRVKGWKIPKLSKKAKIGIGIGVGVLAAVALAARNPSSKSSEISYLNAPGYPRGITNNNPGNIVYNNSNPWEGRIPYELNTDEGKKFEQFKTYVWGVRAMIILLMNYMNRNNLITIRQIIGRWCSGGCDLNSYVNTMIKLTGYSADQPLSDSKDVLKNLAKGIAKVEQGANQEWISDEIFNQAWSLI